MERALWTHHVLAADATHWDATGFALGRVGGQRSADLLVRDLAEAPGGPGCEAARVRADLDAVTVLCRQGYVAGPETVDAAVQALDANEPAVQRAALLAVDRCVRASADAVETDRAAAVAARIERFAEGTSASVAFAAYGALEALSQSPKVAAADVFAPYEGPPDPQVPAWAVTVARVRALATTGPGRRSLAQALEATDPAGLGFPAAHAVVVALEALRRPDRDEDAVAPVEAFAGRVAEAARGASGRARRELAHLACVAAVTVSARRGVERLDACADPALPQGTLARARIDRVLAAPPSKARTQALVEAAGDPDGSLAARALAGLAEIRPTKDVSARVAAAFERDDPGLSAAAAALVGRWIAGGWKPTPPVTAALLDLADPVRGSPVAEAPWIEARLSAADALGAWLASPGISSAERDRIAARLSARTFEPHVTVRLSFARALEPVPDARARFVAGLRPAGDQAFAAADGRIDPPADLPARPRLEIGTDAGTFEVELSPAVAPMNVANLWNLAREGFFDGLAFHRVVPGFVVQGGDPRGDGYGGPGYVVPCEWSNVVYARGSVGMALAGKDTGGSQFFVTHVPTPHLEGRYTWVGRVTRGLEVVDRILPGDRMRTVRAVGERGGGAPGAPPGDAIEPSGG
ncbi:MAG: hypothetical protein D6705_14940 [Deltaproteobacteria bacterium]|nr:MAG: hypothetical protein D6705_14940 [Deltaproteobacteria bacterium]